MFEHTAVCDCCGRTKGDTNHWFLLDAGKFDQNLVFDLRPWEDDEANSGEYSFLCGSECIVKTLNHFLERNPRQ